MALKYIVSLRNGRAVIEATSKSEASRIGKQQFPLSFVRVLGLTNGDGK
jgi:hypothetical protein